MSHAKLNHKTDRCFRLIQQRLIPVLTLATLTPGFVLGTPNASRATSVLPQNAIFRGVNNPGGRMGLGNLNRIQTVIPSGNPNNVRWAFGSLDRLVVPSDNSGATLRFLNNAGSDLGTQLTIARRSTNNGVAVFSFPCTMQGGEAVIGWSGVRGEACTNPQGFRIRPGGPSGQVSSAPYSAPVYFAHHKNQQKSESEADLRYYCNASSDQNHGRIGMFFNATSPEDACRRAVQQCVAKNPGRECMPISLGEWSRNDAHLMLSVGCQNIAIRDIPVNGKTVLLTLQLLSMGRSLLPEMEALGLQLDSCPIDLYRSDTLVVSPAESTRTVVLASSQNSSVEVTAIEGDVIIHSAQAPQGRVLPQGHQYIYYVSSDRAEGGVEEGTLTPAALEEIQRSPVYQDFISQEQESGTFGVTLESVTLESVTLESDSVASLGPIGGEITLSGPAPEDTVVNLSSSDPEAVTVPSIMTIPAGADRASFTAITNRFSGGSRRVTITASSGGITQMFRLTIVVPE